MYAVLSPSPVFIHGLVYWLPSFLLMRVYPAATKWASLHNVSDCQAAAFELCPRVLRYVYLFQIHCYPGIYTDC